MKKFFRLLFSGYIFVFIALLVEVGALIFFQFYFDDFVKIILTEVFKVDPEGHR